MGRALRPMGAARYFTVSKCTVQIALYSGVACEDSAGFVRLANRDRGATGSCRHADSQASGARGPGWKMPLPVAAGRR